MDSSSLEIESAVYDEFLDLWNRGFSKNNAEAKLSTTISAYITLAIKQPYIASMRLMVRKL